jgi:hypothetical protein
MRIMDFSTLAPYDTGGTRARDLIEQQRAVVPRSNIYRETTGGCIACEN